MIGRLGLLAIVWLAQAAPAWAADGPFGLRFGTPISALKVVGDRERGYWPITPPVDDPLFQKVFAIAPPSIGLCTVLGYSAPVEDDHTGAKSFARFDVIVEDFIRRFGNPKSDKRVVSAYAGVLQGIHPGNHRVSWQGGKLSSQLPAVGTADLLLGPLSASSAVVVVRYVATNEAQCRDAFAEEMKRTR